MTKVTGTEDIGFGHFSTVAYWISIQISKMASRKEIRADKVKINRRYQFPEENILSARYNSSYLSYYAGVFIIVTGISAARPGFNELDTNYVTGGYANWLIYAITSGLNFAGGIYIIVSGVRMVLSEIVPAFRGLRISLFLMQNPQLTAPCFILMRRMRY